MTERERGKNIKDNMTLEKPFRIEELMEKAKQADALIDLFCELALEGNQYAYDRLEDFNESVASCLKESKPKMPSKRHSNALNSEANQFVEKYFQMAWLAKTYPKRVSCMCENDMYDFALRKDDPLPESFYTWASEVGEPIKENIAPWADLTYRVITHYHPPDEGSKTVHLLFSDAEKNLYSPNFIQGVDVMIRRIRQLLRRHPVYF